MALGALVAAAPAQASFTQEGGPVAVGVGPYTLVAGDFSGDGRPDVAALNGTNSTVSVMLRQSAGGFAQEGSPIAVGLGPSGGAVADYNGDGRPDIAVSNCPGHRRWQQPTSTATAAPTSPCPITTARR
jgi:FG-GAP-like repeat